jgi:hypothetical protein
MDTKTAIAPLIALWQQRDDQLEQKIIAWAGSNLSPVQANDLIGNGFSKTRNRRDPPASS